ncbi:MAG: cytochrome c peroxidase [Candidatus Competibacterales bacterium]|nr:cytochrome c peroxidase [Candidatus Competibacterales bacterium]
MRVLFCCLSLLLAAVAVAHQDHQQQEEIAATQPAAPAILAPGYGTLDFDPPAPGSYRLPPLGPAADGEVILSNGEPARLHDLFAGHIVLLSFVYTTCSDVNGCPLATHVFARTLQRLQEEPGIREALRVISLSFDPAHDSPGVMAAYGAGFRDDYPDWHFATTASEAALQPILDAYDQNRMIEVDGSGRPTGTFSHNLRVLLIDRHQRIRNIYSVSFLHPDILLNDIRTLLRQEEPAAVPAWTRADRGDRLGPGDDKHGYESPAYTTRARHLPNRRGEPAELIEFAEHPPLGLPPLPVPADNPLTPAKIALGRKLFFDRRLSLNNTQSCAMCHIPEQGFTNNELATAVGFEGRSVRRNAPTLLNVGYGQLLFHDGRETRLEQQVWAPLLAGNEMANPSVAAVIGPLERLPDYRGLFEAAFGRGPDMLTVGQALASYQRSLNAADSPFDRWYYGGDDQALGEAARRGFGLFTGEAGCSACHRVNEDNALFTDHRLHNTGLGWYESMKREPEQRKVQLAPGVFVDVDSALIESAAEPPPNDLGLYEITQDPADRWKYRTPGLRNVALTAPYMHNGAFATLAEVIEFYDQGGFPHELQSPLIRPLGLSERQKADLVAFLESLTGTNLPTLVSDAFAAPVGDRKADDPPWRPGG